MIDLSRPSLPAHFPLNAAQSEQTEVDVGMDRPAESTPAEPPAASDPDPAPAPALDYLDAGDHTQAFWAKSRHPEIPGYRGRPGGSDDERYYWHPRRPPCVPSDERPQLLFLLFSREAAEAAGAASGVEKQLPPDDDSDEELACLYNEEKDEQARVTYKFALRRLKEKHSQRWRWSRAIGLRMPPNIPRGHVHVAPVSSRSGCGWCRRWVWASVAAKWLVGSRYAGAGSGLRPVLPSFGGDLLVFAFFCEYDRFMV